MPWLFSIGGCRGGWAYDPNLPDGPLANMEQEEQCNPAETQITHQYIKKKGKTHSMYVWDIWVRVSW